MKVLITGVSGFVGRYLYAFLKSKGFDTYGTFHPSGCELENTFRLDVTFKEDFYRIIREIKPDLIFHLAGFSSVRRSFDFPELCMKVNVGGTKNLFDAVLDAGIQSKILVISSPEIYGIPEQVPILETHSLNPVTPYGESRLKQEELVSEYVSKGMHIVLVRSFPHTGPAQPPIFVCPDFAKQIAEIEKGLKEPILKVGNLEAERDFSDVRDFVEAYLLALQKCNPGEPYNICSGKSLKIKDMLDKLLSFSNKEIEITQDKDKLRPSDIPILVGDNSKFIEQTGWNPKIKFDDTLSDILNYWRENL